MMSPESGESPGKVIGALDVLNVQISAKKCALALPGGAGMEAALRPLCKVQEPAPGCFTSCPGCCGGGGGGGRAGPRFPAGRKVWRGPRSGRPGVRGGAGGGPRPRSPAGAAPRPRRRRQRRGSIGRRPPGRGHAEKKEPAGFG